MSVLLFFGVSLLNYAYAQTESTDTPEPDASHCINELPAINPSTYLNLSSSSRISPNYSVATSVAYHSGTSTILIGGDFFYIDPKNTSNRTYYQFFQAFSHTNNELKMKYPPKNIPFSNPRFGNKYIAHESLRSWTRIIAHPNQPYFYLLGINNLSAYNVENGELFWSAKVPPCPGQKSKNAQPVIYNDATFLASDPDSLYVAGSCVDKSNHTVVVLDEYNLQNGAQISSFRQLYNLTDLGFIRIKSKILDGILDGIGLFPPEVTIEAPMNESLTTSRIDKFFYVGFTHLMFAGMCRIEHYSRENKWKVHKWNKLEDDWTLVNPSFVSHHNLVATHKGLIALLDPSINGLISLFLLQSKHLTRWDTEKNIEGGLTDKNVYNTFSWYGGHEKYDLHLDWTLSIDPTSNYEDVFITTAPLEIPRKRNSTIAKHKVEDGQVIAAVGNIPFYALDSIVTNDGQLITVGFEWTPNGKKTDDNVAVSINMSSIFPYLERKAVYGVYNNTVVNISSCIGCETNHYGEKCDHRCLCENGYCNDTKEGGGFCYCTPMSYGKHCKACDGFGGSCDPFKGLCDSGPDGSGNCKFCYSLEIDIEDNMTNSSFEFGLGDHYGPQCQYNCTCDIDNGICYTTGNDSNPRAGQCLYCTNSNAWGQDCEYLCECDSNTEYCSNGVKGTGCTKYDYGGLLTDKGWGFYTSIGAGLFVIFFSITWWQTNKQFKAENNGASIPWCPSKQKKDDEFENRFDNKVNNDLKENMIKQQHLQNNDPDQPPAISHMIHSNGNGVIEQDQDEPQQRYDI